MPARATVAYVVECVTHARAMHARDGKKEAAQVRDSRRIGGCGGGCCQRDCLLLWRWLNYTVTRALRTSYGNHQKRRDPNSLVHDLALWLPYSTPGTAGRQHSASDANQTRDSCNEMDLRVTKMDLRSLCGPAMSLLRERHRA